MQPSVDCQSVLIVGVLEKRDEPDGSVALKLNTAFGMKYMIPNPTKRLHYIVFTIPKDNPVFMIYKTRTDPVSGDRQMSPLVLVKKVC